MDDGDDDDDDYAEEADYETAEIIMASMAIDYFVLSY